MTPTEITSEEQAVANDWARNLSSTRLAANLAILADEPTYHSQRERLALLNEAARRLLG